VGDRWATGRVEAFSDGVLAIAITLLVLEIHVPAADFDNLWRGIANQWPSYLAFATSFLTIGAFWLLHHGVFRRLRYADARVMQLNLLLLMAITFLPFPTRLMAEAIHDRQAERAAVILYGLNLLTISVLYALLWEAAVRGPDLLEPDVTPQQVAAFRRVATPSAGFYVLVTAGALLFPKVAVFGLLAIAILVVLRVPGDQMPGGASKPK
jgi:TMEM175 potassium channel family protein